MKKIALIILTASSVLLLGILVRSNLQEDYPMPEHIKDYRKCLNVLGKKYSSECSNIVTTYFKQKGDVKK